ncbi:MAG: hypothetical protein WCA46_03755 [Actinocatenispora sp.]
MDSLTLTLASPAGMLAHAVKAYSTHPVDLTYAALDKLGLPASRANTVGVHTAIRAVLDWMYCTGARPGVDPRDIIDVLARLDIAGQPDAVRDVADTTAAQLLSWIWGDPVSAATGRRQQIAQQLGHDWETDDGFPHGPYATTIL